MVPMRITCFSHFTVYFNISTHILFWITRISCKLVRKYINFFVALWKKIGHQEKFHVCLVCEAKLSKSGETESCWQWQLLSKLLKVANIIGKNNLFEVIAIDSCNVRLCLWQSFGLEIFPSSSILIKTRNKEPSNMRSPGFI